MCVCVFECYSYYFFSFHPLELHGFWWAQNIARPPMSARREDRALSLSATERQRRLFMRRRFTFSALKVGGFVGWEGCARARVCTFLQKTGRVEGTASGETKRSCARARGCACTYVRVYERKREGEWANVCSRCLVRHFGDFGVHPVILIPLFIYFSSSYLICVYMRVCKMPSVGPSPRARVKPRGPHVWKDARPQPFSSASSLRWIVTKGCQRPNKKSMLEEATRGSPGILTIPPLFFLLSSHLYNHAKWLFWTPARRCNSRGLIVTD